MVQDAEVDATSIQICDVIYDGKDAYHITSHYCLCYHSGVND